MLELITHESINKEASFIVNESRKNIVVGFYFCIYLIFKLKDC